MLVVGTGYAGAYRAMEASLVNKNVRYHFTLHGGRVVDEQEVLYALQKIDEDQGAASVLDPELIYLFVNKGWVTLSATRMRSGRVFLRKEESRGLTPKGKGLLLTGNFAAAR